MKKPHVSVVIPVFNGETFITETLTGLLRQSYLPVEILVIDNGSTDDSILRVNQIIQHAEIDIIVHSLKENKGAAFARNYGIEKSRGDWVLFMDADDIACPDLIAEEVKRLEELKKINPRNWVLVFPAYQQIDAQGNEISGITRSIQAMPEEILGYLFVRNVIMSTSGVLALKNALIEAGGFDSKLRYSEDYQLWLQMAALGGFAYVDKPLVKIRRHSSNISKNLPLMLEGEKNILESYSPRFIKQAIERRSLSWEKNQTDIASVFYKMDLWDEGYQIVSEVIKEKAAYATGYFLKGIYFLHRQDWSKALDFFSQTLYYDENHGAALNNLAALQWLKGEFQSAQNLLAKALNLYPNYQDALRNLELFKKNIPLDYQDIYFTWRELRPVLLTY